MCGQVDGDRQELIARTEKAMVYETRGCGICDGKGVVSKDYRVSRCLACSGRGKVRLKRKPKGIEPLPDFLQRLSIMQGERKKNVR